jgi:hypothetical protein
MTACEMLAAFEALSPADQHQVAAEIVRRSAGTDELPDTAFHEVAAELFRGYEAREA